MSDEKGMFVFVFSFSRDSLVGWVDLGKCFPMKTKTGREREREGLKRNAVLNGNGENGK